MTGFLPLLFSAYPVLALLAYNANEIKVSAGIRALAVAVGAAYLLWGFLSRLLKDGQRAAILTVLLLIMFFSYGHLYGPLERYRLLGLLLGRHRILFPLWLLVTGTGAWWVIRRLRNTAVAARALLWIGLAALAFPLAQLLAFEIRLAAADKEVARMTSDTQGLPLTGETVPPDIYYIILDAYSRDDILKDELGFDNAAFLEDLEGLGFYVSPCSQSNYAQTELSLSSALNFDYLQALDSTLVPGNKDRSHLWPLLRRGKARQILERSGYTSVAFETGFAWSEMRDADMFFSPSDPGLAGLEVLGTLTEFEGLLVKSSAGLVLADAGAALPKILAVNLESTNAQDRKRQRVLFTLETLKTSRTAVTGPKFVFAHFILPHFPYVFGPDGEAVFYPVELDQGTYQKAYTDQVAFLNQRLSSLLREIIRESTRPPIVILQGDHGHDRADSHSRMKILNAYYLPGGGADLLYPTISPVNTFRVVLNYYFGAQLPLLEDISYFSTYQAPYDFTVIPNTAEGCLKQ